jgi:primosomal protein DnaI
MYFFDEPREIKEAKWKDIYPDEEGREELLLWLDSFFDKYEKNKDQKGLYLHGNFGCGKTYLVSAMFNELAKANHKVAIIY